MATETEISDRVTIRIALIGWAVRRDGEAERMDKWADEEAAKPSGGLADKCRANAAASRRLAVEARECLARQK